MHSQTVQEVQLTNLFLSSAVVQLMMIIDLQTYMLYNTHTQLYNTHTVYAKTKMCIKMQTTKKMIKKMEMQKNERKKSRLKSSSHIQCG